MKRLTPSRIPHGSPRASGSTLSEVLISMLVLAIGVVSVATLFPLSVLRALRANEYTQATVLRYNAEAAARAYDLSNYYLFFGPDRRPGVAGVDDDGDATPPPPPLAVASVPDLDVTSPTTNPLGFSPGPDGLPGHAGDGTPGGIGDDDGNGVDDNSAELGYSSELGLNNNDGDWTNDPDDVPNWDLDELFFQGSDDVHLVLIDPLGYHRLQYLNNPASNPPDIWQHSFGNRKNPVLLHRVSGGHPGNNQYNQQLDESGNVYGFNFSPEQAEALVTLPDSLSTLLETPVTGASGTPVNAVTLPTNVPSGTLAELKTYPNEDNNFNGQLDAGEDADGDNVLDVTPIKVTVFYGAKQAAIRTFDHVNSSGRNLVFRPALPAGVTAAEVEKVTVQVLLEDFTWMISARLEAAGLRPDMDVVVFHKRRFAPEDEALFNSTMIDGDPGAATFYNQARISFTAGNRPFVRQGGYMFDAENNFWYRVQSILRKTSTRIDVRVDRPILDFNGDGIFRAAFPRGVVEVYPIGRQ